MSITIIASQQILLWIANDLVESFREKKIIRLVHKTRSFMKSLVKTFLNDEK